jgi:hypothetical protein
MNFAKIIFVAALASACAAREPAEGPFAPETGVIFRGNAARQLIHQCSRQGPGPVQGAWTPNAAEISEFEPKLAALVERRLRCRGESPALATDYYRQYGGLIIDGSRIIYVNGIASGIAERHYGRDWRRRPMGLCDGGSMAFGAEFNPATGEITNFTFDGSLTPPPSDATHCDAN